MTKKCLGCGSVLQTENRELDGYVEEKDYDISNLCRRCFRMKYYGEFHFVERKNDEFIDILKGVSETSSLVLYLVDLFTLTNNIDNINKYLKNDTILVITKRDIMPKSINNDKILQYIKNLNTSKNIKDIEIISSINNEGLDALYNKIKKYQTEKLVYIVGNTNAGKSTLINKMMKNYSTKDSAITTSILPATTLGQMNIQLDKTLTLVDTPGLIDESSFSNYVDIKTLKRITPKKEIKPKTFQLKVGKTIEVENLIRMDYLVGNKNSFTAYFSNDLRINQINVSTHKKEFLEHEKYIFDVKGREDIVINGLGYIKIVDPGTVTVYVPKGVNVVKRDSLV